MVEKTYKEVIAIHCGYMLSWRLYLIQKACSHGCERATFNCSPKGSREGQRMSGLRWIPKMNWSIGVREVKNREIKIGVTFILGKMNQSIGTRHIKKVNGEEGHFRQMGEQDIMYGGERVWKSM